MITRFCFAFALGVSLEACFGGDIPSTDRLLSRSEVYEIAEHVRELPPYRCDVTVIVEFALRPIPESDLRRSVEKMYREMDTEQGKLTSPTQFSEEVSKEVERLLQEQLLPRRIKERLRREGQRYRIDEVRTQTGLEAIDASTAWQRSFINLCDGPSSPRDSAKRDWNQKILSIFGSRHGNIEAPRDAWAGGTVGFGTAILLKQCLGMDLIARDGGSDPVESQVSKLLEGDHDAIDLRIRTESSDANSREFVIRPKKGAGLIQFTTPLDGMSPVRRIEMRDDNGTLTYQMEVKSSDANGVATRWVEMITRVPGKGLETFQYDLLDRRLNLPLEDDTFSISQPEGWTIADHRPEQPIVIGPDGNPVPVAGTVKSSTAPTRRATDYNWMLIFANVTALVGVAYVYFILRSRRRRE